MPDNNDSLPEHVLENRAHWDKQAPSYVEAGRRGWAGEPSWGIWEVPETQLHLLPADMTGLDTIELGCGTAYVSAWLARRGARPVGIDNSPAQLATARAFQREFGLEFPLHLGNAEATPFASASFDFAISEYGAAIWCDPYQWIPEAARLLKPGGQLIFLGNSTLMALTLPELATAAASERLLRPQRGMHRFEWSDTDGIEFHLSPGAWILTCFGRLNAQTIVGDYLNSTVRLRAYIDCSLRSAAQTEGAVWYAATTREQTASPEANLRSHPLSASPCTGLEIACFVSEEVRSPVRSRQGSYCAMGTFSGVPQTTARNNTRLVGLGASAGGMEPLKQFFANVPAARGLAISLCSTWTRQ